MNSFTTDHFWHLYRKLPEDVRLQARTAYKLFRVNPYHPSLQFKSVSPNKPYYSARVSIHYRVVCRLHKDEVIWFWIGSHSDYDKLLRNVT
jgi:hypothetical protein